MFEPTTERARRPLSRQRPAAAAAGVPSALILTVLCMLMTVSRAEEADPNILQSRARVAGMAEQSMAMLASHLTVPGTEGWAVFTADPVPPDLDPGVGLAKDMDGESYFLQAWPRPRCLTRDHRHVLVFRDPDLFRDFRQGELQGDELEPARTDSVSGKLLAFSFRPSDQPQLEPMDLSGCRFALHKDLQRALVAKPDRTEGMVDEDDVDVDDN